jgi:hypothetical protein
MSKESNGTQEKPVKRTKNKGLRLGLIIGGIIILALVVILLVVSAGPKVKLSTGSIGGNFRLDLPKMQSGEDVAGERLGGKDIAGKKIKFHITSNYTEMEILECQVVAAGKNTDSDWSFMTNGSVDINLDIPKVIGSSDYIDCNLDADFKGADLLRSDINYEIEY